MKGLSLPILIVGLLFITIASYFLSNSFCGASGPGFAVRDGKFNATSADTYKFTTGKSSIKMTEGTNKSFKYIADYLKKNEFKTLALTGTQFAGESGNNLGAARAAAVKSKLVKSFKAPEGRITVAGQTINNKDRVKDKTVYGGVEFVFAGEEADGDGATMEKKTNGGAGVAAAAASLGIGGLNHTFLFPDSKVKLTKTDEMEDYLRRLKSYLKENPGSKLSIVGHTDNSGSESSNMKRAETMVSKVRRFFRNNKLSRNVIFTDAKGSTEPEVDQSSPEAANLNNRVVLSIRE